MAVEVTATELKNRTGQVLEQAQRDDVIINRQGRPYAAIVAWPEYQELQILRRQRELQQRRVMPEQWREIRGELEAISRQGDQQVNLAEWSARDRLEH
jgi:prevent-host-death family protein